jgi:hypothetical protein
VELQSESVSRPLCKHVIEVVEEGGEDGLLLDELMYLDPHEGRNDRSPYCYLSSLFLILNLMSCLSSHSVFQCGLPHWASGRLLVKSQH